MGVLFVSGHYHEKNVEPNLSAIIQTETYHNGPRSATRVFTPLAGISYLLFILIYMPCIAVIATVKKESSSWKWTAFLIIYTTSLAWLLSFSVFQIGSLFI
jgi:ferrous iron transport protein B